MMTNVPAALPPHCVRGLSLAARSVPYSPETQVYSRPSAKTSAQRWIQVAGHAARMVATVFADGITHSTHGTEWMMERLEAPYGEAPLVEMRVPPSWQMEHDMVHIDPKVDPRAVLVRGGRFAVQNAMTRVGTHPPIL